MQTYGLIRNTVRYGMIAAMIVVIAVMAVTVEARTYPGKLIDDGATPEIYGDAAFQGKVQQAIGYLAANYPADYKSVVTWLEEIRPTDTYTRVNNAGVCYINGEDVDSSYYWLAGQLIHEAQHVNDDAVYFAAHPYTADESEHRAPDAQAVYLESVNGWTDAQASLWVTGWLTERYWETIPEKYA